MTLVATPPNLVVNSELLREGYHGFSFFSVTPIGLVVLVLGILYMLVMRFMLKGDTQTPQREGWTRRTFRDLIREYRLTGRARRLAIRPGSPMIGQRLDDLKLRERYGANVIGVERWRRFRRVIVNVNGVSEFRARDVLICLRLMSISGNFVVSNCWSRWYCAASIFLTRPLMWAWQRFH